VRRPLAGLILLSIVAAALAVGSVRLDSATSDEPAYLAAGMIKLLHGRLDFFRDQPPLMNSISAAPLVLAGYRMVPAWQVGGNHWAYGQRLLYLSGYDAHRMLFLARLPTIVLFLALSWAVYFFVAHHAGSRGWGVFGFALTAFCPTVMAHGRLATVDLAVAFFSFSAAALFVRLIEAPAVLVAVGVGVASGAAVMSKTSANLLGPYFLLLLIVAILGRKTSDARRLMILTVLAGVVAAAFIAVLIVAEGSDSYVAASFPDTPRLLVPFAEYVENIRAIRAWYTKGAALPQFLFGAFSKTSWWYYYPAAFLIKATIPALLLIAIAAGIVIRERRVPFGALAAILFVALFMGAAAAGELALGIRYVLPVFPFLYAATAILLARAPRVAVIAIVLAVWHGAENLRAYPSYISYFNQFIGSHRNADRYLIDSNLDWGQDLRRLDRWLGEKKIDEVVVHYFGGGAPQFDVTARVIGSYGAGGRPLPRGSWFALSRHLYRLSFAPSISRENYDDYLARSGARYVATVGGSINVYRVE
jgi:4-amino-4-deoxy-L-arabinose transferase-like glycosyltransferase